jgi:hypothetical protein
MSKLSGGQITVVGLDPYHISIILLKYKYWSYVKYLHVRSQGLKIIKIHYILHKCFLDDLDL